MNISELEEAGAFVQDEPVKKEIVWKRQKDGKAVEIRFEVYIRPQSFGAIENVQVTEKDKSKMAGYVSKAILNEKGEPVFTYEKAFLLNPAFGTLLLQAINDVNSVGAALKN